MYNMKYSPHSSIISNSFYNIYLNPYFSNYWGKNLYKYYLLIVRVKILTKFWIK